MIAAVFGGAYDDDSTLEYKDAVLIGEILSNNGYIVKCGGYKGIMEAVSMGVYNSRGEVIGYTCKTFNNVNGNKYLTKTIIANDIYDRLRFLIEDTDLFIVHRGGIGTLSELFLSMDIIRKRREKPKIILVGYIWIPIIESISSLFNPNELDMITIIKDNTELYNIL